MPRQIDPRFGERMRALLQERGLSYRALAGHVYQSKSLLHDLASGKKWPSSDLARRIDDALRAGGELIALAHVAPAISAPEPVMVGADAGVEAIELARRVQAQRRW
jgi:transcriptional regulator with XRE-family HTH domain